MANVEKLQFPALKKNRRKLCQMGHKCETLSCNKKKYITEAIIVGNKSPPEHIAEAIIFLKKHLDENLTHDYGDVEDPAVLWQALKDRFDHQKEINLPHALEEWKCYKCGCKGHWSRTCRTPPHLCKLYQESIKGKAKEMNLTKNVEGTSYLESSDFANELD
ncbi:hypothetical protein YC2023_056348 [Brassica napus]